MLNGYLDLRAARLEPVRAEPERSPRPDAINQRGGSGAAGAGGRQRLPQGATQCGLCGVIPGRVRTADISRGRSWAEGAPKRAEGRALSLAF
jgi:hypothetical protein